jgi:IS30 family transposase
MGNGYWSLMSVQRQYWELVAQGVFPWVAGPSVGVSHTCGVRWFRQRGGVNPQFREPAGQIRPRLSIVEREEIMVGTSRGESIRSCVRSISTAAAAMQPRLAPKRCSAR